MADVWFVCICSRNCFSRIVIKHPRGWLNILHVPPPETIWGKSVEFDANHPTEKSKEVKAIQECLPWRCIQDVK